MNPVVFLEGERIYLRPLSEQDIEGGYVQWLNDPEVCAGNSHHVYPYSREDALAYVQAVSKSKNDVVLAIVLKEGDVHIGNIALQRIHWLNRSAEFAILLGDKTQWGKGVGVEAGRLLVKHGFRSMGLHRIHCGTFETNQGMRKLALALGMKEEGTRRQAAFKNGEFLNVIEFGVLTEEAPI